MRSRAWGTRRISHTPPKVSSKTTRAVVTQYAMRCPRELKAELARLVMASICRLRRVRLVYEIILTTRETRLTTMNSQRANVPYRSVVLPFRSPMGRSGWPGHGLRTQPIENKFTSWRQRYDNCRSRLGLLSRTGQVREDCVTQFPPTNRLTPSAPDFRRSDRTDRNSF